MSDVQYKVTLCSGKEVVLKEYRNKHRNTAAQACAHKAGSNQLLFQLYLQDEILKVLIVSVNGKRLKSVELEDLDSVLTVQDQQQLMSAISEMMGGGDKTQSPKLEILSSTGDT